MIILCRLEEQEQCSSASGEDYLGKEIKVDDIYQAFDENHQGKR